MTTGIIHGNAYSINIVKADWAIPAIDANTTEENTFTLKGVKLGDFVIVSKNSHDAGVTIGSSRVSADDTVAVTMVNATGSEVDAADTEVTALVIRPEGDASNLPTGLSQ